MRCHAGGIRNAVLAWVAAAAMFFASAAPLIAGHEAFDQDCAPASTASHDHAAHRLSQAPAPAPDHCVACHLTRADGRASIGQAVLPLGLAHSAPCRRTGNVPHLAEIRTDFTRGPPSNQL